MPRNRSEKSPSGDPMIDDHLRAWLRWYRAIGDGRLAGQGLSYAEQRTLALLSNKQRDFMEVELSNNGRSLTQNDVVRLVSHEPEFQHGTQQV